MEYFNVQDIMDLTKLKKSKCYEIIRQLNISYKKEYPQAIIAQGCIPKFYFEKAMGIKVKEDYKGSDINEFIVNNNNTR